MTVPTRRRDELTEPDFAAWGFARGQGWGMASGARAAPGDPAVGTVTLLTARNNSPDDWLRAGRALQRTQAEGNMSVVFHTQPLEIPELREAVRSWLCGAHPQMLLRLGVAEGERATVRRTANEVTDEDF